MSRLSRAFGALVAIAVIPFTANAAVMSYTYSGVDFSTSTAPYTSFSGITDPCDPAGAGPCAITNITAEIVIEELGANQAFGAITPVSWSISDGLTTVTDSTAGWGFFQTLQVSTDGNGDINSWLFNVIVDDLAGVGAGGAQQMRTRDFSGFVDDQTGYCQIVAGNCTSGVARVETFAPNHVGSWTVSPVPVPGAVWFFGSALALLGWRQRMR